MYFSFLVPLPPPSVEGGLARGEGVPIAPAAAGGGPSRMGAMTTSLEIGERGGGEGAVAGDGGASLVTSRGGLSFVGRLGEEGGEASPKGVETLPGEGNGGLSERGTLPGAPLFSVLCSGGARGEDVEGGPSKGGGTIPPAAPTEAPSSPGWRICPVSKAFANSEKDMEVYWLHPDLKDINTDAVQQGVKEIED